MHIRYHRQVALHIVANAIITNHLAHTIVRLVSAALWKWTIIAPGWTTVLGSAIMLVSIGSWSMLFWRVVGCSGPFAVVPYIYSAN